MRALSACAVGLLVAGALLALSCAPPQRSALSADAQDLTARERRDWQALLEQLPSPCPESAASIAQCLEQPSGCRACSAASSFVRKAVRDGRDGSQVRTAYQQRFGATAAKPIDLNGAPSMGPSTAEVTVVEYADYQCPFCASTVPVLDALVADFSPHVRVVFKSYPLASHAQGEIAAQAGLAAHRQGKFWPMHHKMFANQQALQAEHLDQYAREIGLSIDQFHADMKAPATTAAIRSSYAEGTHNGVQGTPAIFVNGRAFDLKHFDLAGGDLSEWVRLEIEIITGRSVPMPAVSANAPVSKGP